MLIEIQADNFWEINQGLYIRCSNAGGVIQDTTFIGAVYEARTGKITYIDTGDSVSISIPNLYPNSTVVVSQKTGLIEKEL